MPVERETSSESGWAVYSASAKSTRMADPSGAVLGKAFGCGCGSSSCVSSPSSCCSSMRR